MLGPSSTPAALKSPTITECNHFSTHRTPRLRGTGDHLAEPFLIFDPPLFSALLCRCPTSSSPYCHGLLINGKASGSPHRRGETQKLRGKCLEGSPRAEPPPSVRPVDRREEETRLLLLSNAGGRSCGCSGPLCRRPPGRTLGFGLHVS